MKINRLFLKSFLLLLPGVFEAGLLTSYAQGYDVNKNAHSHNDYLQSQPFYLAHANRFASMEIDVYLIDNELYVAHDRVNVDKKRTIERLYLEPLISQLDLNNGKAYPGGGNLQFMIDFKTAGEPALKRLQEKLQPIRKYFDVKNNPSAVRLVITGSAPTPARYAAFDNIFYFDGRPGVTYTPEQLKRVAFFSTSFQSYSKWNGLGRMIKADYAKVKNLVDSVHALGKPIRFWGSPDTKTTWQAFIKLGVDYLNTDSPNEMARFLNQYESNSYVAENKQDTYIPSYKKDGSNQKPKNVILLISDGAGFSELWAAATANGGNLNATYFKNIGFANTAPSDDYNTDSAAGATALATGEKSNNRYIGMDSKGERVKNITELLSEKGMRCGIISNDQVTGATPSSFFAHQTERDLSDSIAADVQHSPAALIIAGYHRAFDANGSLASKVSTRGFSMCKGLDSLSEMPASARILCFDNDKPADNFHLIEHAFSPAVDFLSKNSGKGFFLVVEGAKIDGGGHSNKIKQCIDEYLSFDNVIGQALKFADKDGETLVVVTSDHETGGLIILDGNYETGTVVGTFTTNDHTGVPVPVLSYGPGANRFTGFIQNSDIQKRVVELLK